MPKIGLVLFVTVTNMHFYLMLPKVKYFYADIMTEVEP